MNMALNSLSSTQHTQQNSIDVVRQQSAKNAALSLCSCPIFISDISAAYCTTPLQMGKLIIFAPTVDITQLGISTNTPHSTPLGTMPTFLGLIDQLLPNFYQRLMSASQISLNTIRPSPYPKPKQRLRLLMQNCNSQYSPAYRPVMTAKDRNIQRMLICMIRFLCSYSQQYLV